MSKSFYNFPILAKFYPDFIKTLEEVKKLSPSVENIEKIIIANGKIDHSDYISTFEAEGFRKSLQKDEEHPLYDTVTFEKDLFDMLSDASTVSTTEKETVIQNDTSVSNLELPNFNCNVIHSSS